MNTKKSQSSACHDAAQDTTAHTSTAQGAVSPSIASDHPTANQNKTAAQGPKGQHTIKISIPSAPQSHDGLVKRTLLYKNGKCLKALIKNSLPEHKLKHLDLSDFKIENPEDFDDDQNPLRADFVVSVGIKGSTYRATVVLLIEHKSYLDHAVLIQVLRYQIPIIKGGRLPLLTIVIFHNVALEKIKKDLHQTLERKHPVLKDPEFKEAFQENILNFNCEWVDLTTLTENLKPVLEEDEALTLQMLSCTLKHAKTKSLKQQAETISKVFELGNALNDEDYGFLIRQFLDYFSTCGYQENSFKEAKNMRKNVATSRERKIVDLHELRGQQLRQEGIEQGIAVGRHEALMEVAIGLLDDMSPNKVALRTKLPLEQVLELHKKTKSK